METRHIPSLPKELILLWHTHRLEILVFIFLIAAGVRFAIHWRNTRGKDSNGHPVATPIYEKQIPGLNKNELSSSEHYETDFTTAFIPPPSTRQAPRRVTGIKMTTATTQPQPTEAIQIQPFIFHYSLGGTTAAHAASLQRSLPTTESILPATLHDLSDLDYDDYFISPPSTKPQVSPFYILLIPSYDISTELENFTLHLRDTHHDFRIDTAPLSSFAGYCVLGFGDSEGWLTEEKGFGRDAVVVDRWMSRLTAGRRAWPVGVVDVRGDVEGVMRTWREGLVGMMEQLAAGGGLGEGVPGAGEARESGDEDSEGEDHEEVGKKVRKKKTSSSQDLEDIQAPGSPSSNPTTTDLKAMVPKSSPTYTSLTKQGYTILGTHSAVKTCRWTKSALRGRGSCYKFSFYGIASHRCMEATPSLSCSNKCVFCWRHGTNPVSTTWRWQVDDPNDVFEGMKKAHLRNIKSLRGVPGVRSERFTEALEIRHCALSLVGEPVFYPRINELLALLHGERISTFLVCNAQHPDHLARLSQVTQLYVSVDASNKESLKRIDRPLHRDYWERFLRCMDILREKRFTQRTVFRLTLVKGFNVEEEVEGYAALVDRARPSFVEVKGVTYCGTSTSAGVGLSMQNVPFYEEVAAFVSALALALGKRGLDYGIAAEHAHSCCVLVADRGRYFRVGEDGVQRWHTLIDYAAFFANLESGGGFGPEDYIGPPTPDWALWGQGGFDPRDERVDRKGRPKGDGRSGGGAGLVRVVEEA